MKSCVARIKVRTSLESRFYRDFEDPWDDQLQVEVDFDGVELQAILRDPSSMVDKLRVRSLIFLCNIRPNICFIVSDNLI